MQEYKEECAADSVVKNGVLPPTSFYYLQ